MTTPMLCYVYRSRRKADTYLYIDKKDDFSAIPEPVLEAFGIPEYSMSFQLDTEKKLAQADSKEVMNKISADGFYLQLPRSDYDIAQIVKTIAETAGNK